MLRGRSCTRVHSAGMSSPSASPPKKTAIQRAGAVNSVTVDVWTIWYASRYGKLARVRSILDRKAVASIDVQEYRTRWSALHFACRYGHSDVVELLVQRGADTELPDWQGNTPLHLSAGWGNLRCCVLVLESGANVGAKNHANQTAEQLAAVLARKDNRALLAKWKPLGLTNEALRAQRLQAVTVAGESEGLALLRKLLSDESNERIRQEMSALYVKRQTFGDHHPGLLATYSKLVALFREDEQRFSLALQFADEGLMLCELVNGRPHISTARWLAEMGALLLRQGRHDESADLFAECHTEMAELKGETDHESLVALENAAIASLAASRFADAQQHLQTLLDRLHLVYGGGSNLRTLGLSLQLARLLVQDKQVDKALALFSDCLTLSINLLDNDHELVSTCTDGLGKCLFLLGDFERAETQFQRSLHVHRRKCKALASGRQAGCSSCLRAHNNLATLAVAARSANAVRVRLASDLKQPRSDL